MQGEEPGPCWGGDTGHKNRRPCSLGAHGWKQTCSGERGSWSGGPHSASPRLSAGDSLRGLLLHGALSADGSHSSGERQRLPVPRFPTSEFPPRPPPEPFDLVQEGAWLPPHTLPRRGCRRKHRCPEFLRRNGEMPPRSVCSPHSSPGSVLAPPAGRPGLPPPAGRAAPARPSPRPVGSAAVHVVPVGFCGNSL